jgi:hypothetical protein
VTRHPEVPAERRASKDAAPKSRAVALRGSLRSHLRVTEMEHPRFFDSYNETKQKFPTL